MATAPAIIHTEPPASDPSFDVRSLIVATAQRTAHRREMSASGWTHAHEAARVGSPDPEKPAFYLVTYTRPKFRLGEQVILTIPNQPGIDGPALRVPAFVMGQWEDGKYKLFVCSFEGSYLANAIDPDAMVAGPLQPDSRAEAALACEIHRLSERLDALEEAATARKGK
jgi:hypothetical protein